MNLSSTSWIRQPDDSYSLEELRCVYYDQCHALSPSASYPARITASSPLESSSHEAAVTRLRALHTTATYDVTLNGTGHLIKGRTHREVLADLRRLRGEANTLVLRRLLFRWGLYAVRRAALRELEHDTRLLLWQRLGGRCFAWWRLVTERRLCREALYEEAARREAALLRDTVGQVAWTQWQRWARHRARRRDRAMRLALVNRQRHALLRFYSWGDLPRQRALLRQLQRIRFTAERRLARLAVVRWRLHMLERLLLRPLEVRAALQTAHVAFLAWQRRAWIGARLRHAQREASWSLALRSFQRWKLWLRRTLQAALLQRTNETRQLLHVFTGWVWQHQLRALSMANEPHWNRCNTCK